ncbi:L,D-transpeptidase family protein [Nocardia sp. NBC_01327]|uniref:L,D-transpeptidase family protein n=1 Tax=Nocardia sp. NBC_01327 TaxID=2903593 RepID=UPI002E145FC9|nr:L,D-transpeptidase family protein [Nocardia sp. NBC_01327]
MGLADKGVRALRWTVAIAVAVLAVVMLPRLTSDRPPFDPNTVPGTQVVWVSAPAGADHGTLELWQRNRLREWKRTFAVPAWVGAEGISTEVGEGRDYTPEGTFGVSEGFGRLPDPAARLPYLTVDPSNTWWWVSDSESPLYNRRYRCAAADCPFDTAVSENLGRTVPQYNHALVIDYNRAPAVPGKGSAFFVHGDIGAATAGCVAVSEDVVRTLLATLQPSKRPVIAIHSG